MSKNKILIVVFILIITSYNIGFSNSIIENFNDYIEIYFEGENIKELNKVGIEFNSQKLNKIPLEERQRYVLKNVALPIFKKFKSDYEIQGSLHNEKYIIEIYNIDESTKELFELINANYNQVTIRTISNFINSKYTKEVNPNYEFFRSTLSISEHEILKAYSTGRLNIRRNELIDVPLKMFEFKKVIKNMENPIIPRYNETFEGNRVPILMYHELNNIPKDNLSGLYVSRENFKKQLDFLKEKNYNTISMEQFYNYKNLGYELPKKPIVLTFDDGYKSHIFATNEINKRGFTGTFYIIASDSWFEIPSFVNKQEVITMDNKGMEIGSHTMTHVDARYTSTTKLENEYKKSKEVLEKLLKKEIGHFCFPIGGTTSSARKILENNNYKTGVLTKYGKASTNQNNLSLNRIRIFYYDNISKFENRIN